MAQTGLAGDAHCVALVRERDADRYIATLWAPAAARPGLFALHALDLELLGVVRTTTEPMLGRIRLAWWRERLVGLGAGEVPAQPVLAALAAHVVPAVRGADLAGLEDAMLTLLDEPPDVAAHARLRGGVLFGAAARLLGGDAAAGASLGAVWAAGEAYRLGRAAVPMPPLPDTAAALRPLRALARLAQRDLAAIVPAPRGSAERQARIAWTNLTGR